MSTLILPVDSSVPHYQFQVDLEGQTYGLEMEWNDRAQAWFGSLYDAQENPLVSSVRIVVGFPLFTNRGRNPAFPPGVFLATDTSGQGLDPGLTDLGQRVQLLYFPIADVVAA